MYIRGERRHHNNKGYRYIKSGHSEKDIQRLAKKLGIPYKKEVDETLSENLKRQKIGDSIWEDVR